MVQAWDYTAGRDSVHEMQHATATAQRIVVVLSPAYLQSAHGEAEWRPFYAEDPSGERSLLLSIPGWRGRTARAAQDPGLCGVGARYSGSHHATCAYSWISPLRRSRRTTLAGGAKTTGTPGLMAAPAPKCGAVGAGCNGWHTRPAPTVAAGNPRTASDPAPNAEPCPPTAPHRHSPAVPAPA